MTEKKYQVLFYGEILPGSDIETVKNNLAEIFNVDKKKIEGLFSGGKKVVKKDSSRDVCEKTKKIFKDAGAVASVVPQGSPPAPPTVTKEPAPGEEPPARAATPPPIPDNVPGKRPDSTSAAKSINKTALLLLTFFLGGFGVHKFYLAKNIQGIFYLLFSWTFIPLLFSVVDFLIYLFTDEEKLNSKYRAGATPLVIIMAVCGPFVFIIALSTIMAIAFPIFLLSDTGQKALAPIMEKAFSQSLEFEVSGNASGTIPVPSTGRMMKQTGFAEKNAALKAGGTCSGKIHGQPFSVDNAYIQNGILHLGQGTGFFPDQEMVIFMFLKDNDVSSQRFHVSANDDGFNHPHIHLKWQSGDEPGPQTEVAMKGYDLDIEFGQVVGKTVQGKIDLNIPGGKETCLAGTFTAQISDE